MRGPGPGPKCRFENLLGFRLCGQCTIAEFTCYGRTS